jgi:hypothetical protein
VKIFLNFKIGKKSQIKDLSKTFKKLFGSMKSSCPKCRMNTSTVPNFYHGSVVQQGISGGGGLKCEESAFLNSLHAHIRSGMKGASAIGPQLGEVFSPGGRGQKA